MYFLRQHVVLLELQLAWSSFLPCLECEHDLHLFCILCHLPKTCSLLITILFALVPGITVAENNMIGHLEHLVQPSQHAALETLLDN